METERARAVTAGRLSRRLGLDANPLRRASDRAESWIRLGLTAAFLAAAPFAAIGTGHWMERTGLREARAQAAAEHPVRATVLQNVPAAPSIAPYRTAMLTRMQVRWAGPGGSPRTGEVTAARWARAGSTVIIWITASDRLARPPLPHSQITIQVILLIALTLAIAAFVLLGLLRLSRYLLDRGRLARWEAAWLAVGPHWTGRDR